MAPRQRDHRLNYTSMSTSDTLPRSFTHTRGLTGCEAPFRVKETVHRHDDEATMSHHTTAEDDGCNTPWSNMPKRNGLDGFSELNAGHILQQNGIVLAHQVPSGLRRTSAHEVRRNFVEVRPEVSTQQSNCEQRVAIS